MAYGEAMFLVGIQVQAAIEEARFRPNNRYKFTTE
jgi:hypothetical protein